MSHLQVRHDLSLKTRLQKSQLYHAAMAQDLEDAVSRLAELESLTTKYRSEMDRLAELAARRNTEAAVRLEQNEELQKKLKWTEEKLADLQTSYNELKALKGAEIDQNNNE